MREGINNCVVEGILSEIDLTERTYEKNGAQRDAITGTIKVKVKEVIEGQEKELEVPVHFFSNALTNAGSPNPSYESLSRVMHDFKAIAAVGEENADRVRVTGANISPNEYYAQDGRFVTFPRVRGSFVTRIKPEDTQDRAVWEMELFIQDMKPITDSDGVETGGLEIVGIHVGYNERADVVKVKTNDEKIAKPIQATFERGQTVPMSGKLNFSSSVVETLEEVEIGEPIKSTRTVFSSDLIITGVKSALEEGYSVEDIQKVVQARAARLEQMKEKSQKTQGTEKKAPAKNSVNIGDLGF